MRGRIWKLLLVAAALFLAYMASFFVYPDVGALAKKNPGKTAFMEWREAQWAKEGVKKTIVQRWVPISRVSPLLIKAVLIGEDDKFYHHEGFDYEAMEQALEKNMREGRFAAGASTISQQLIKNLYLSPEKSLTRKVKEAILTWRMEHTLSKRRILELYVNVAEWGDGIFGIEAASRHYFHKSASALSSTEAARLASVLPNPIKFSAVGGQRYVTFRSGLIHSIMVRRGIAVAGFQEVMETKDEPGVEQTAPPAGADSAVDSAADTAAGGAADNAAGNASRGAGQPGGPGETTAPPTTPSAAPKAAPAATPTASPSAGPGKPAGAPVQP
ncbi:MAG: monofunctional biosynthetic peptidoglycan transglycosylase [Desulfovibrionaceae bacterium CG1_02_65_16]|nr:MAG: monofunctional biosynthetic peptidoglycan transglycosylase [Desulfovibrionaceae bacterium CG1_02_65_16]